MRRFDIQHKWQWLWNERSPRILRQALNEYGTTEIRGNDNNTKILDWADELGSKVGIEYNADSIPWCGLFIGICAERAGYEPPNICVRAKEWLKFGVLKHNAKLGDIIILERKGGGHVGLYIAESTDGKYVYLLGGNQSDQVNIRKFKKNRVIGIRRCKWKIGQPKNVRKIIINDDGVPLSENEA